MKADWRAFGECLTVADPDIFFSNREADIEQARQICRACSVRSDCLNQAMSFDDIEVEGMWGASTQDERTLIQALTHTLSA